MRPAQQNFSPRDQANLCRRFLDGKVDWPDFNSHGRSVEVGELSFHDLVRSEGFIARWAQKCLEMEDERDKQSLVGMVMSSLDGKLFSLARVVQHFDMQDIVGRLADIHYELRDHPDLPSELPSPMIPRAVVDHAEQLVGLATMPSVHQDILSLFDRSSALWSAVRDVEKFRFVSPVIVKRADGSDWGALDTGLFEKHLESAISGVFNFVAYLESHHNQQRSVDQLAGNTLFEFGNLGRPIPEQNILGGPYKRHMEMAYLALDNLRHGLQVFDWHLELDDSGTGTQTATLNNGDNGVFESGSSRSSLIGVRMTSFSEGVLPPPAPRTDEAPPRSE